MLAAALALCTALASDTPPTPGLTSTGPPPRGAVEAMIGAATAGTAAAAAVVVIYNGGYRNTAIELLPLVVVFTTLGAGVGEADGDGTFLTAGVGSLVGSVGTGVAALIAGLFVSAVELALYTNSHPNDVITADDVDLAPPIVMGVGGAVVGGVFGAWMGAASNDAEAYAPK